MVFQPPINTTTSDSLCQCHLFQMGLTSAADRLILSSRKQREAVFLCNVKRCLQVKPIC